MGRLRQFCSTGLVAIYICLKGTLEIAIDMVSSDLGHGFCCRCMDLALF
ncbi:unnamed protein product [Acidithrix sp. C25]|nr:unnamed protein product [Acidithrix sp. C25]